MKNTDDIGEFVSENSEMLSRILVCGNSEARGYALALVANSGEVTHVEEVQEQLELIRQEMES